MPPRCINAGVLAYLIVTFAEKIKHDLYSTVPYKMDVAHDPFGVILFACIVVSVLPNNRLQTYQVTVYWFSPLMPSLHKQSFCS